MTLRAVNKAVGIPRAKIKGVVFVRNNSVAGAAGLLISKAAVPCSSLKRHRSTTFLSDLLRFHINTAKCSCQGKLILFDFVIFVHIYFAVGDGLLNPELKSFDGD